jgi:hypothetical protein
VRVRCLRSHLWQGRAAGDAQGFSIHVAGLLAGQEDVGGASSAGWAGRPIGDSEDPNCVTCSAGMVAGTSGVHTAPARRS